MKILLVCSIFPPDIGGPAIYAKKLAEELEKIGDEVRIVSGKNARSLSSLLREARRADVCYALSSSPRILIPLFFAARFWRKKIFVRIGGDFLWERAFESGASQLPLKLYYEQHKKSLKEKLIFTGFIYAFNKLDGIIFSTHFQKELYKKYYKLKKVPFLVIENPYPKCTKEIREFPASPLEVIYAGRLLELKNIDTLLFAFHDVRRKAGIDMVLKIIGEGPEERNLRDGVRRLGLDGAVRFMRPMPQNEIFEELKKCWLAVLPSISEVSPNFVLDACACGAPILTTREVGLSKKMMGKIVVFNPQDKRELTAQMYNLLDSDAWSSYQREIVQLDMERTFKEVVREHRKLFQIYAR